MKKKNFFKYSVSIIILCFFLQSNLNCKGFIELISTNEFKQVVVDIFSTIDNLSKIDFKKNFNNTTPMDVSDITVLSNMIIWLVTNINTMTIKDPKLNKEKIKFWYTYALYHNYKLKEVKL